MNDIYHTCSDMIIVAALMYTLHRNYYNTTFSYVCLLIHVHMLCMLIYTTQVAVYVCMCVCMYKLLIVYHTIACVLNIFCVG